VVEVERVEEEQPRVGRKEVRRKEKERQIEGVSKSVEGHRMELELLEELSAEEELMRKAEVSEVLKM